MEPSIRIVRETYIIFVGWHLHDDGLREVVDSRVLHQSGKHVGEAHQEEDVQRGRVRHLGNPRSTCDRYCARGQQSCDSCKMI